MPQYVPFLLFYTLSCLYWCQYYNKCSKLLHECEGKPYPLLYIMKEILSEVPPAFIQVTRLSDPQKLSFSVWPKPSTVGKGKGRWGRGRDGGEGEVTVGKGKGRWGRDCDEGTLRKGRWGKGKDGLVPEGAQRPPSSSFLPCSSHPISITKKKEKKKIKIDLKSRKYLTG